MNNKDKEIKIKCVNCGASLSLEDKKCAYCGSVNPNYKPKEIKDIKPLKKKLKSANDVFGGFFGNVFEDILEKFDED